MRRKIKGSNCSFFKTTGGDGWHNFELAKRLNFVVIDKSIQRLRKIYKDKPEWFEIPDFAQKVY
jgi:hypothetical protein